DVTRDHDAVAAAREEARLDPLTGLLNRRAAETVLADHLRPVSGRTAMLAVLDLDDFKQVNDRFGHVVGDRALRVIAERLVRSLREGDHVARFGGDEFVAVIPAMDDFAQAHELAERMRRAVEMPLQIDRIDLVLRCSIGVTLLDGTHANPETALAIADRRMYRDKGLRMLTAARHPTHRQPV
ncbi:MAG: GGDEF domain-containing protein, partial [Pseudomonadota bacterium]